ncbi:response regulator transcription factor [Pedobacter montanisoli]|uniref:DNA-binding response regulator n=1 Tax=Pedobacter montanisoli TaxID=2923277 RepID=A0ABS9ZZP9_9SPHI|nr:DNA-binding response regulator [Pedobacter montanisoli]MCJ0743791.1 DNA-binding response regulator [Pedobacter montanisoli]
MSILIVEDELITAEEIAEFLTDEGFEVLETWPSAQSALKFCSSLSEPPKVAICDINLKGNTTGIELAANLVEQYQCEIIFLSAYVDASTLKQAFNVKPVMYVSKPYLNKQLLVAVHMAMHNYYQRQKDHPQVVIELSKREREIVALIADGLSSKQAAEKLFISKDTVNTHRRNILHRYKLNNFSQLIYLLSKQEK